MRHTDEERKTLLSAAREVITAATEGRTPRLPEPPPRLLEPGGAFVTLHKRGALRGCIGHILADRPLWEVVQEMAYESAFRDPRFPPVTGPEVPLLDIEISILSSLFPIAPEEVEVGTHGLLIRKGWHSGLLLPQVPVEQGWDRETFLAHTCLKAGLPPDAWKSPDAQLFGFTAEVFGERDYE
ncbi:AmmeMemoRadiSam system protein A [Spirochaeta thermophila]|uniref:AMMECR1 domain-containing protein n=1 Tax=Winmispira thermophila (strain ATCC 49972 / DSM 6192 / RI 19.B1) TaxID=665571 RepID=E0RPB4_WINT6|nr:AmmeMemoRadiSam system protein A [Spirochaeta thermophila]ADN01308.1 hypothetical protein STHERM_c03350 [Spirochaeta thermophila DSM 6192]